MKNFSFCFLLLLSCFISTVLSAQETSWYKHLQGTVGKYEITMHLHKTGDTYAGYYFYNNKEEPIQFYGEDTTLRGRIKLFAFSGNEDDNENFVFSSTDAGYSGEWQKGDNGAPLTFTATEIKDDSLIPFEMIYTTGEADLRTDLPNSPKATYEATSVWPTGNMSNTDFIKQCIVKAFDSTSSSVEIENVFSEMKDKYLNDYKNEYKDVDEKDLKERPFSFSMELMRKLMVVFQSSQILSLANYSFEYTGGAHGNYGTAFIALDVAQSKKLTLDDVFTGEGKEALSVLLEKYFRRNRNIPDATPLKDAGLFENKIEPTGNFFITAKGIGFSYTPYEIAPYAMGEIIIFIPFAEIETYLQPGFKGLKE